jgi:hypothetical protein
LKKLLYLIVLKRFIGISTTHAQAIENEALARLQAVIQVDEYS